MLRQHRPGVAYVNAGAVLLVLTAFPSCASFGTSESSTPADSADAEAPDGGVIVGVGRTDDCIETPSAPQCLDESKAFFVSPAGDDGAAVGTKAKPFKTLAAALAKVSPAKKRIYICDGTYDEDVRLTPSHTEVSLFGGITCNWSASPNKPTFGHSTLALRVDNAKGVAIASIAFAAKDATDPGASSIAAFLASAEVTFNGVSLTAGKGANGADGTLTAFVLPDLDALKGTTTLDASLGGAANKTTCPAGPPVTIGGKGGNGTCQRV